jgi:hypothetical protein
MTMSNPILPYRIEVFCMVYLHIFVNVGRPTAKGIGNTAGSAGSRIAQSTRGLLGKRVT